ncbi:MAG: glycosyltransferase [Dehalococcoidia bacterium]
MGILATGMIAPNVEAYLGNLGRLLVDEIQLDLVLDRPASGRLAERYGCQIYPLRMPTRGLRRLESFRALLHYTLRARPDILTHAIDFETLGMVATLVGRLVGVPTITRYAGQVLDAYRFEPTFARRLKISVLANVLGQVPLHCSDRILTLGPALAAEIERHGGRRDRVTIVPQPVDRSLFRPVADRSVLRAQLGLPQQSRLVLFAGRLEYLKGADVLHWLIPRVLARRNNVCFCLIGAGEWLEPLRASPAARSGALLLPGVLPHDQVALYMQAADLFVYPSRTDGLPTVLLEAVACGVPVISRAIGDARQVTSHLFQHEDELLQYLLRPDWPAEELPAQFDDAALACRYRRLFQLTAKGRRR